MANHELLKLTANQVQKGGYDKVILALGSCEAHGKHLAEGTDTIVSYKLAQAVADRIDGMLVLPPITIGYSAHYDAFPFTLTLGYETMIRVIYDVIESTLRNGINKIFLMNGHDGNIAALEVASRRIKEKYPHARIASLPAWWVTAGEILPPNTFEVWNGMGHAGEGESSIAYHLFPQWCEPELADCVLPDKLPKHVEIKWDFAEITDNGATGDATKATPEKGKMMTEALVECVVNAIKELDAIDWDYRSSRTASKI